MVNWYRLSMVTWIIGGLLSTIVLAQSPVIVHIDTSAKGTPIPADFSGLSFESSNLLPDKDGTYQFSDKNTDLVRLFRTIGIRNLRLGGGTADGPEYKVPGPADIDQLFAFAKAADVKVIYTLRLLNGDQKSDAEIARYVEQHYPDRLVCFQIGNEPDWHSFHTSPGHEKDPRIVESVPDNPGSAYSSFLADWREFASAINTLVPAAAYAGPDTGSNYPVPGTKDTDFDGQSWSEHFARDEKSSGHLLFVTQHDYTGQSATDVSVPKAISSMLSKDWVDRLYPMLFTHVLDPVEKEGFSYRMTEANDYTGGVNGASNAYASALWALDYLHWHAEHGAAGVNFHNKRWIYTDTVYLDASGKYRFNPKAYAIRAFDVGSNGNAIPLSITNDARLNLTAYAVRGDQELYVTLINKEYGEGAREATVTLIAKGVTGRTVGMFLKAPKGDVTARDGITFGGAPIANDRWDGSWTELSLSKDGQSTLQVPPASALVVKVALK